MLTKLIQQTDPSNNITVESSCTLINILTNSLYTDYKIVKMFLYQVPDDAVLEALLISHHSNQTDGYVYYHVE